MGKQADKLVGQWQHWQPINREPRAHRPRSRLQIALETAGGSYALARWRSLGEVSEVKGFARGI